MLATISKHHHREETKLENLSSHDRKYIQTGTHNHKKNTCQRPKNDSFQSHQKPITCIEANSPPSVLTARILPLMWSIPTITVPKDSNFLIFVVWPNINPTSILPRLT